MPFDSSLDHRRSIRLRDYDYSLSGAYYVTICAYHRVHLFGKIVNGEVVLNETGRIILDELSKTESIRSEIKIVCFIIMPNHIHVVLLINETADMRRGDRPVAGSRGDRPVAPTDNQPGRWRPTGPKNRSLGAFVGGFKSAVTKRINLLQNTIGQPVWQRNYYEHVIRDEDDYERITEYIHANPMNWSMDEYR